METSAVFLKTGASSHQALRRRYAFDRIFRYLNGYSPRKFTGSRPQNLDSFLNSRKLERVLPETYYSTCRFPADEGNRSTGHGPFFVILDDTVCEKPSLRHRLRIGFKGLRFNILISKVSPSTGMLLSKPCFVRVTGFSPLPQNVTIRKQKQNRFGL